MKDCLLGTENFGLDGAANTIQHMIAMGLDDYLRPARCDLCQETCPLEPCPAGWQMYFRILDQEDAILLTCDSGNHDRENLREPKSDVHRSMEVCFIGGSDP